MTLKMVWGKNFLGWQADEMTTGFFTDNVIDFHVQYHTVYMVYSCKFIRRPMFTVIFGVNIVVLHIFCLAHALAGLFRGRPYGESVSEHVELRMTWEDGSIDEPSLALDLNIRHVA